MPLIFVMLSPAQPALIIPSDNTDRGRPPQMRTLDNFSYDNYKELPSQFTKMLGPEQARLK